MLKNKKSAILLSLGIICLLVAVCIAVYNYNEYSETNPETESTAAADNTQTATVQVAETPSSALINDFEAILQEPELPTGCEITALTMMLNFYGFDVDKVTMATQYLPCTSYELYTGDDGKLYGKDLNSYFIGDPTSVYGYVCGTGAIITAANDYFSDCESDMQAVDLNGSEPEELYELVSQDTPVLVWVTISMADRDPTQGWYIEESGEYVEWSTNDHGAVLIGYSDDTVTVADPISGIIEYDREQFESVFNSRGNRCVIITYSPMSPAS